MPLITSTDMIAAAAAARTAVCAFNVENMEMAQAVVAAAEEAGQPVILQTTPSTLRYATPRVYAAMVAAVAADARVPVAMHLDHGSSFELAVRAVRAGYTSVMIDGSVLAYEDNVAVTADVVRMCRPVGIPVEGELGRVGGKEDDLVVDAASYTDPDLAADFVARTGVTTLAVGIGTVHGPYHGEPAVDLALLSRIRSAVDVPLVLHGSSGLPDETVRACVRGGTAKVNFATELRIAASRAVADLLAADPNTIDPKVWGSAARSAVREAALAKIALCAGG